LKLLCSLTENGRLPPKHVGHWELFLLKSVEVIHGWLRAETSGTLLESLRVVFWCFGEFFVDGETFEKVFEEIKIYIL
jgi:hypothetical protein